MRPSQLIITLLIVAAIFLGLYFFRSEPVRETKTNTTIAQHKAEFRNNVFLQSKLEEFDFWEKNKVEHLEMILSDEPQDVEVAKRMNQNGQVVTSLSYSVERSGENIAKYTLYVNPELFPPSDTAELERQYTQLALIAIYQTTEHEKNAETHLKLLKMLTDYRGDMKNNSIFSIQQ